LKLGNQIDRDSSNSGHVLQGIEKREIFQCSEQIEKREREIEKRD